jgi:hypothetical protein
VGCWLGVPNPNEEVVEGEAPKEKDEVLGAAAGVEGKLTKEN